MNPIHYERGRSFAGLIIGTAMTHFLPNPEKIAASIFISIIFNSQIIYRGFHYLAAGNRFQGCLGITGGVLNMACTGIYAKKSMELPSIDCIQDIAKNAFYDQNKCILPLIPNLSEHIRFAKMVHTNQCAFDGTEIQAIHFCSNRNEKASQTNNTSHSWLTEWSLQQAEVTQLITSECTLFGKVKKALFR